MTQKPPSGLQEFNAQIVQAPLQGLFRNLDAELTRRLKTAIAARQRDNERVMSLFLTMLRFTNTAYEALSFLASTMDDAPKRKREFLLVMPPTNRQLLDLLFTLVYMTDDFDARSMNYELAGYRQAREEFDKYFSRFGTDPSWQKHFQVLRESITAMEAYLSITPKQRANPSTIPYWYAPYRMLKTPTRSQSFLEFLEEWVYGETSAQAHLNPAGFRSLAMFLLLDFAPQGEKEEVELRTFERFRARHFFRTLTTVFAILSEIDTFCKLSHRAKLMQLWVTLGAYSDEANDVYKQRYQALLS